MSRKRPLPCLELIKSFRGVITINNVIWVRRHTTLTNINLLLTVVSLSQRRFVWRATRVFLYLRHSFFYIIFFLLRYTFSCTLIWTIQFFASIRTKDDISNSYRNETVHRVPDINHYNKKHNYILRFFLYWTIYIYVFTFEIIFLGKILFYKKKLFWVDLKSIFHKFFWRYWNYLRYYIKLFENFNF